MSAKKPTRKHSVVPPKLARPSVAAVKPSIAVTSDEPTPRIGEVTTVAVAALPDVEAVVTITQPVPEVADTIEEPAPAVTVAEVAISIAAPAVEATVIEAPAAIEAAPAIAAELFEVSTPAVEAVSTAFDIVPLLRDLRDTDADIARDAAIALGQQGDLSAVEPLIEALSNGYGYYHGVVRAAAAASLGQLRDTRAFYALTDAINDPMAEASAEAVRALGSIGDDRAIDTLIDIVRDRDNFYLGTVRRAAVEALGKLGGDRAFSELQFVAGDSYENSSIRDAASEALGAPCCQ